MSDKILDQDEGKANTAPAEESEGAGMIKLICQEPCFGFMNKRWKPGHEVFVTPQELQWLKTTGTIKHFVPPEKYKEYNPLTHGGPVGPNAKPITRKTNIAKPPVPGTVDDAGSAHDLVPPAPQPRRRGPKPKS